MASIVSFTFREAVEDVEYKGRLNDIITFLTKLKSNTYALNLYLHLSSPQRCRDRGVVSLLQVSSSRSDDKENSSS